MSFVHYLCEVNTTLIVSEDSIKSAVISFLKSYYRFRPRSSDSIAQKDMITSTGIYADGHISFLDENGHQFVSTFEATSIDTSFEVRFRVEKKLLFWDALTAAALSSAFLFSFIFAYKNKFLISLSGAEIFFGLIFSVLIINILYRKILYKLPRYRSIFAIERFKQYYADEQWIALGEDIFLDPEDPYLKELKKQCVYNGFGLITVNTDGFVQLHITPAREVVYGKKRRKIPFLSTLLENQMTQKAVSWTQSFGERLPLTESSLLRYHQPYNRQMILCGISLMLTVSVFYRYVQQTTEKEMVSIEEERAKQKGDKVYYPEPADLPDSLYPQPYKDKINRYAAIDNEPQPALTQDEFTAKGGSIDEDGVYLSAEGNLAFYDCSRLNLEGNNFIIKESEQVDLAAAKKHIAYLNQYGIEANCIWLGCFSKANLNYIVFIDLIYENKKSVLAKKDDLVKLFASKGVASKLAVVSLTN